MTLQQLLHKARGEYELTIFRGNDRVCEDEEIPEVEGCVDFREYVPEWDSIKTQRVEDFRLEPNRNYTGPAIWVKIE